MPKVVLTAEEKMHKAKIRLQELHPFFSYLIMCLRMIQKGPPECKTLSVNREGELWYHDKYVEELGDVLVRSVLAHEVLHVILGHLLRAHRTWDRELANVAMDIVANAMLVAEGFELHPEWLCPRNDAIDIQLGPGIPVVRITDIRKKCWEEVYHLLEQHLRKHSKSGGTLSIKMTCPQCQGSGQAQDGSGPCQNCGGTGGTGEHSKRFDGHRLPSEKSAPGQPGQDEGEGAGGPELPDGWKFRVTEALAYARQRGTVSGNLQELVTDLVEPRIDWRSQLLKHLTAMLPCNMTWKRPHKKSHSLGTYLPGFVKESLEVVLHVDSSGSISSRDLADFLSEVAGILRCFQEVQATLIVCDCRIQQVEEFRTENADELSDFKVGGRGGTSHKPVVEWINENKTDARVLVTLTDGESDIEQCFDQLPEGCERIILLTGASRSKAEDLEKYGNVIVLETE